MLLRSVHPLPFHAIVGDTEKRPIEDFPINGRKPVSPHTFFGPLACVWKRNECKHTDALPSVFASRSWLAHFMCVQSHARPMLDRAQPADHRAQPDNAIKRFVVPYVSSLASLIRQIRHDDERFRVWPKVANMILGTVRAHRAA